MHPVLNGMSLLQRKASFILEEFLSGGSIDFVMACGTAISSVL